MEGSRGAIRRAVVQMVDTPGDADARGPPDPAQARQVPVAVTAREGDARGPRHRVTDARHDRWLGCSPRDGRPRAHGGDGDRRADRDGEEGGEDTGAVHAADRIEPDRMSTVPRSPFCHGMFHFVTNVLPKFRRDEAMAEERWRITHVHEGKRSIWSHRAGASPRCPIVIRTWSNCHRVQTSNRYLPRGVTRSGPRTSGGSALSLTKLKASVLAGVTAAGLPASPSRGLALQVRQPSPRSTTRRAPAFRRAAA